VGRQDDFLLNLGFRKAIFRSAPDKHRNRSDGGIRLPLPPLVWQNAILTFLLSIVFGIILGLTALLPLGVSLLIILLIVALGILFDIIGVSVASSEEKPLHAMGSDRITGARQAIWLVRRAESVANVCNDVVGDVCNTISGAITASFTVGLAIRYSLDRNLTSILVIALIAAVNVGGKALGKIYAMKEPQKVILRVGRILLWLGFTPTERRGRRGTERRQNQERR